MPQDTAPPESLGCFRARQASHNAMENSYKSLPLVQRKRYRHDVGSSRLWNALLSPDSDLELFFPLEEGGNGCYLYKCTFWKAATSSETLGGSKECCSHVRMVQVFPAQHRRTLQINAVRRGRSYPRKTLAQKKEASMASSKLLPLWLLQFRPNWFFLRGSRLLHCSPQLGQVITLKSLEVFQRSRAYFFLLIKKKMDELAKLPLAGTWSQVSE